MKGLVLCLVTLAVVIVCLDASPSAREETRASSSLGFRGLLQMGGLVSERTVSRHARQEPVCVNASQCYPAGITGVPSSLIECLDDGRCSCQDCFELADNGTCVESSCVDYRYDVTQSNCQDDRPTQLIAFLLSFFLSYIGAANFYIGRDDLGGAQLFLLVLLIVISLVMCYLPCCLACCIDDVKGNAIFACLMLLEAILTALIVLAMVAWWIADLVIFIKNDRDAGNGCMLKQSF